jgi:hypothetical protein
MEWMEGKKTRDKEEDTWLKVVYKQNETVSRRKTETK